MIRRKRVGLIGLAALSFALAVSNIYAAKKPGAKEPETAQLTAAGEKLQAQYAARLANLKAELNKALPTLSPHKIAALQQAHEALQKATTQASAAHEPLNEISKAEGLVKHGQWWTGDAKKKIAKAEADLHKATTDAARQAAQKTIADEQKRYEAGVVALKERQAALDKAKTEAATANKADEAAKAALARAQAEEGNAAKAMLAEIEPFLASDKYDAKLVQCAVLSHATPRALAEFAQQGKAQEALVEKLLADNKLMQDMLIAGGAKFGKYGRAMEIYAAIQQVSPKAREGLFQRLSLATALEHTVPLQQRNADDQTNAPKTIDPVQRYLHYEKAYLNGELDPAFKNLNIWEYRMVIDCNAPDQILGWGREMLRTYRPDHIYNANYGWRYVASVKTEVPYGSQNVKNDLPSLQEYQNIIKDGGVCGRRAFFGRFILQAFGIPVWGVTQHAHAALSHWTPKGWVVNLGAGFQYSWWDKDEEPRSGADFLLESQARERGSDYLKVLRAQWVSCILGEKSYNDRKKVDGGLWSKLAHYETVALASQAVALGPLGQELAEANEPAEKQPVEQAPVTAADKQIVTGQTGTIVIPAVAHAKSTGRVAVMKSFSGGLQIHCSGGFQAQYVVAAPQAGKYSLAVRVATAQEGQKFLISVNDGKPPIEIAVPYTIGLWQQTQPVEVVLGRGQNVLQFAVKDGSRGVTIKEFTLTPVK